MPIWSHWRIASSIRVLDSVCSVDCLHLSHFAWQLEASTASRLALSLTCGERKDAQRVRAECVMECVRTTLVVMPYESCGGCVEGI